VQELLLVRLVSHSPRPEVPTQAASARRTRVGRSKHWIKVKNRKHPAIGRMGRNGPADFCISTKKRRSVMGALKMLRTTKFIATMALTFLISGTVAIAQTKGAGSSGAASSTIPQAPIGHRQPRADQVPPDKNLFDPNDALAKENAILDRKMKSICRGC
jgi:hypothetical protein